MEVAEIYYKAKDGRFFTDPIQCEEYEKTIGIIPGSVGDIISDLDKQCNPDDYVHGLVYVRGSDGSKSIFQCTTICAGCKLDPFVNLEDLDPNQLFITTKVKEVVEWLGQYDKDCPAHYFLVYSENIDMTGCGAISMHNPKVWKEKK